MEILIIFCCCNLTKLLLLVFSGKLNHKTHFTCYLCTPNIYKYD